MPRTPQLELFTEKAPQRGLLQYLVGATVKWDDKLMKVLAIVAALGLTVIISTQEAVIPKTVKVKAVKTKQRTRRGADDEDCDCESLVSEEALERYRDEQMRRALACRRQQTRVLEIMSRR